MHGNDVHVRFSASVLLHCCCCCMVRIVVIRSMMENEALSSKRHAHHNPVTTYAICIRQIAMGLLLQVSFSPQIKTNIINSDN